MNAGAGEIGAGDRIAGAPFAGRSTVWGRHGAAATAHPLATLAAIDVLRMGGSAVDAAIAANAVLGLVEPIACGIGGDAFALVWDPLRRQVLGLNGSGASPLGLSLESARLRAVNGLLPPMGAVTVSVPGAVAAWWDLHQSHGRLPWRALFKPAIELAEEGHPLAQTVAYYLARHSRLFTRPGAGVEETENFQATWAPEGRTPAEGEVFRNPGLARTLTLIAEGGAVAFYEGEIAETIERYFARIGGWMTRRDLAAHRTEWVSPVVTSYRDAQVYGLGPNTQGVTTLQILNMMETFDVGAMGFQSAAAIHHGAEAKRLAFEDRARWFADPRFSKTPVEQLLSKDYARQRAALIRPDRVMDDVRPGEAPSRGDTTYLCTADASGQMVSLIQSNYAGMGSGLVPDGLGFMFQNRGELFALTDGHPNLYAPGKRPFHTIIPGFACKGGEPWLAFGVMGGGMQPQGQAQAIMNLVDFGLGLQEAGDAPRWRHEGSAEPTGEPQAPGSGVLMLEAGVPAPTRAALAGMGWRLGDGAGGYGGYQAIERLTGRYAAASEMRKDGLALAY